MPDVFISYAHRDNQSPRYGSRGWVECFYDALLARLNGIRGRDTSVWRDQSEGRITGNSLLTQTIKKDLKESGVLLAIVSPAYLASQWCADELKYFCEAAAKSSGLHVDNHSRIIKVGKLPIPKNAFVTGIEAIDDAIGYPFFGRGTDGNPLEFDPPHGTEGGAEFWRALNAVAFSIDAVLQKLEGQPHPPAESSGSVVYVAETSWDMREQRERVRGELEQFGHAVLPASEIPHGPDYADRVKVDLAAAKLSIHLIGDSYGAIPERSNVSIVETQYRLAGEEAQKRPELVRLAWMPPGLVPAEERQIAFLEELKNDSRLTIGSIEDFKTLVQEELKPKESGDLSPGEGPIRSVYLIFDPPDREAAKPVDDWLHHHGFEVLKPLSSVKKSAEWRSIHRHHLKTSAGVLIYHGQTSEEWLQSKLIDLEKVFGYGRSRKQEPARGVMLADPATTDKQEFRSLKVRVLKGFGGFSPAVLDEFLKDLQAREGNAS